MADVVIDAEFTMSPEERKKYHEALVRTMQAEEDKSFWAKSRDKLKGLFT